MINLVNFFYILIIFLIINKYYKIKKKYLLILLIHFFSIFLFNDFLFEPNYMPDQFKYLEIAKNIRIFDFFNEKNFLYGLPVYLSGLFFGLFPIPFIGDIYSICMINFLLYFIMFIFLYKKKLLKSKFILWFYLLYPSLSMYSVLALRDMLIFFIISLGLYYILIIKKYLIGIFYLYFLLFIKFQNLIILIISFIVTILFSKKINIKELLLTIIFFIFIFIMFKDYLNIEKLNFYRLSFYNENLSDMNKPYNAISSYFDLLIYSIPSIMRFLFRPLPWEEFNLFQIIQFFENLIIFILLNIIIIQNFKYKLWLLMEVKFLNIFLFLFLLVYGLVIYNSGTAVRYKFPIISIYIIYSWFYIYEGKKLNRENNRCVE